MPLFSEHISNMYYSGSPSYTTPYTGYSSVLPLGSSYGASYLSHGGNYSSHSSLGGYSRAPPLSSRWVTSSGRNYSPMLSTISERSTSSPVRLNSPRRIPYNSKRSYVAPSYTPRPININTADIDVSKDKYRHKQEDKTPPPPPELEPEIDNGPFMPRVDGKPETGIDSSPGIQRSTLRRGRTVVRLHTIIRKDRDSPRKPQSELPQNQDVANTTSTDNTEGMAQDPTNDHLPWREKLSEDLAYKDKREKKTLGAKLVEKFIVKDKDSDSEGSFKEKKQKLEVAQSLPAPGPPSGSSYTRSPDRRCSLELLAEQAKLLDTLIRGENLSTATLDLSTVGLEQQSQTNIRRQSSNKRRKSDDQGNPLQTTKSDHSLNESIKFKDAKNFSKRRSLKKSSSGGSICRLDSIKEFPREPIISELPVIEEISAPLKRESVKVKPKPKLKAVITSTVEVTAPKSPLKFKVDVTVEESLKIPKPPKKEIIYSATVDDFPIIEESSQQDINVLKNYTRNRTKPLDLIEPPSPEPDDGNFWDKIGKRETVYLMKRKQIIDETIAKNRRELFWFPEEEERNGGIENDKNNNMVAKNLSLENDTIPTDTCQLTQSKVEKLETNISNIPTVTSNNISPISKNETNLVPKAKDVIKFPLKVEEKIKNPSVSEIENQVMSLKEQAATATATTSKTTFENMENSLFNENLSVKTEDNNKSATEMEVEIQSEKVPKEEIPSKNTTSEPEKKETEIPKNTIIFEDLKSGQEIQTSSDITKVETCASCGGIRDTTDSKKDNTISSISTACKAESDKDKETKEANNISAVPEKCIPQVSNNNSISKKSTPTKLAEINASPVKGKDSTIVVQLSPKTGKKIEKGSKKTTASPENKDKKATGAIPKIPLNKNKVENNLKSDKETKETRSETEVKPVQKDSASIQTKVANLSEESKPESITTKDGKTSTVPTVSAVAAVPAYIQAKVDNQKSKAESITTKNGKPLTDPTVSAVPTSIQSKVANLTDESKAESISTKDGKTSTVSAVPAVPASIQSKVANQESKTESITTKDGKTSTVSTASAVPTVPASIQSTVANLSKKSKAKNVTTKDGKASTDPTVPAVPAVIEPENIPRTENELKPESNKDEVVQEKIEVSKLECLPLKVEKLELPPAAPIEVVKAPSPRRPVKEEAATRPLIATPRPLQKRVPQVIHSSSSSESSSEEESSEDEDADESDTSESTEFFECENNPDGRTSTGSNDSGFDSSAPTSPAGFLHIKKDCDVNCHWKCEKLTANLCGVNQRLLVEALASRTPSKKGGEPASTSAALPEKDASDLVEHELEQSTAYELFRKTGRFTPPARSIPRFRKYNIEDFHFIKVLGKGSFGKVLLAELRDTEYYYAVKCLKKDVVLEDDDVECTLIERKVLALGTNHPYLCHLFATFQTDSHLFFVMEYLNGGDLMFHIQQSGRFPEARARFYAAEIVSGLKFLHKRGIVYRDLKLDNILLDFDGHVRIADFGMCKLQIYLDKTADTFCGTPDYMAPEIIKGLKYNQTVDWWSFGVLLYEMLIGQSPFSGCDEDELFWSICNEMPSYPRFLSHDSLTILTRLLDKDARTRLGGTECMYGDVRDQDFFRPIHWDKLERRELEAPFRPRVRHPLDTQYFDKAFTVERPRLTAVDPHVLRTMAQDAFRGFSYTNPNATDR